MVLLVQFGINLHLPKRLVQFQLLKDSLMQINSKLNSKPYDYLYLFLPQNNRIYIEFH